MYCMFCGGKDGYHFTFCSMNFPMTTGIDDSMKDLKIVPMGEIKINLDSTFDKCLAQLCQYLDSLFIIEVALDAEELKNGIVLQKLHEHLKKLINSELLKINQLMDA